jgi:hypothetical protein
MAPGPVDESWSAEHCFCRNIVTTKRSDFYLVLNTVRVDFHEVVVGVLLVLCGGSDVE